MKLKVFKKGFNYLQDGPGNRLVLHLQGCNMRCPWCSNPEGIDPDGSLIINKKMVLNAVCPHGALKNGTRDKTLCSQCEARECIAPRNKNIGIRLSCEEFENDEIVSLTVDSRAMFYDGGGVTLSGGEPTMQFEAIKELLEKLRENGVNTAMETNGTSKRLAELMPLIDHLIIDYKTPDVINHKNFTGVSDEAIRKNLCAAAKIHGDLTVRTPLIGGVNDRDEDIEAFIRFYKECSLMCAEFEFLPYFDYGKVKWEQCGMEYRMGKDAYISDDTLRAYEQCFLENGFRVVKT